MLYRLSAPLAGAQIPNIYCAAAPRKEIRRYQKPISVGTKQDTRANAFLLEGLVQRSSSGRVPEPNPAVLCSGHHLFSVPVGELSKDDKADFGLGGLPFAPALS